MKVKVLGTQNVDYVNKRNQQVTGLSVHCSFEDSKRVDGLAVDRIFLSNRLKLSCIPYIKAGQDAEITYNRYGAVENFVILDSALAGKSSAPAK